jgi:HD-like signal output (HDOD) protein
MSDDSGSDTGASVNPGAPVKGPMGISFPVRRGVWEEARRLLQDSNVRIENLSTAVIQDPVIVLELLKVSNALFYTGGKAMITSPKTAVVRLGAETALELFDEIGQREDIKDEDVSRWLEFHRGRCKRVGIVSRILAEAVNRKLSDDTQTAGCLCGIGDMLAVLHFKEQYTELADDLARASLNYKLSSKLSFDVEKMGLNYLRKNGVPEVLLFALDRDARSPGNDRGVMRTIVSAAQELVDAFDGNKWEKLAPGKNLSPKSALRMLSLEDSQYLKIYERTSEYLFSDRMLEERLKREAATAKSAPAEQTSKTEKPKPEPAPHQPTESGLQSEIDDILNSSQEVEPISYAKKDDVKAPAKEVTYVKEVEDNLDDGSMESQFSLKNALSKRNSAPRSTATKVIQPPQLRTGGGNQFVGAVTDMFENAANGEELLKNLLQQLVEGPFEKAAIICVSKDRKSALVIASRGPIGNGQRIELKDPLSPLAQCFSKVQSFASKANEASPFGCKSFALAPVDADHDTPVALYADCGDDGALSFEARRIFRTVVDILNQKLPTIPGGLPVEVELL